MTAQNRTSSRRRSSAGCLLVLAGLLIVLGWAGYKGYRLYMVARSLQGRLDEAQALLSTGSGAPDAEGVRALMHATRADVVTLRQETGVFMGLAPLLGWVPEYGGDLVAAPHLLALADDLTLAGDVTVDSLAPLLALKDAPADGGSRLSLIVKTVAGARAPLEQARTAVAHATAERALIDAGRLSPRTARLVARLDQGLPLLDAGVQAALALPDIMGWPEPRTYLLLAQNDDELRPTGGFITAVGILRVEGGAIADMQFKASYDVDNFEIPNAVPPTPLYRFMGVELWLLRDSNWSPDYPTSARLARQMYERATGGRVDGVIAVNQHMLQLLVGALGPLTVEGSQTAVTDQNLMQYMADAWGANERYSDPEWGAQHKAFIGQLAGALMAQAQSVSSADRLMKLGQAVLTGLERKDLLLYLPDSEIMPVLAARGWDGALQPAAQDTLLVTEWNAGYTKTNVNVDQSLQYRVDLTGAHPAARVQIDYRSRAPDKNEPCAINIDWGPSYQEQTERCHWSYVRVFAPAGAQLLGGATHSVPAAATWDKRAYTGTAEVVPDESGRAVFGNYLLVPRAQSASTWFEYALPDTVLAPEGSATRYALYAQKQPGTRGHPLTVEIVLPAGARVLSADPAPAAVENGVVRWLLVLDVDRHVQVVFAR